MKNQITLLLTSLLFLTLISCGSSTAINRFSESKSKFSSPTNLMSNNYPEKDIYRVYEKASSGFTSINSLRKTIESRVDNFANAQQRGFVILGEKKSNPPYVLGNFPRIEIVFALIDKNKSDGTSDSPKINKISELERLKKLFDDGALTKEEYEKEKKVILER